MIKIFFATDIFGKKSVRLEIEGHSFILGGGKECNDYPPYPGFMFENCSINEFAERVNSIKHRIGNEKR